MKLLVFLSALLCSLYDIHGDIYLHNPRGSNNRLFGRGRARRNANRLFDSQNNNRGGYNGGPIAYYEGSKLQVEWTNQHSCGNPNSNCEVVLQYMCSNKIRNGRRSNTIPFRNKDRDLRYGMHEDYAHYLRCFTRRRNQGLFTADQNLKGGRIRAIHTRQNPNGQRRGLECPEERDYYPYWHSSPWRDIAVLTNNVSRCAYYKAESQNVKERWECRVDDRNFFRYRTRLLLPNNEEDCKKFRYGRITATWTKIESHKVAAPDCRATPFNRDNHHGNTEGGSMNTYNWTVPDLANQRCAFRIRYNISTADYQDWGAVDASHNAANPGQATKVEMTEPYGFSSDAAATQRGYIFKGDPIVKMFPNLNVDLRLAVNTAQFGRTFEDRSHRFFVLPRTAEMGNTPIHNVNVRGKRGNIVQVYPAVEYDFTPETLVMKPGEYIHFQFTGSNSNPRNNAGNGPRGTDRSNAVLMGPKIYSEGSADPYAPLSVMGHLGRSYPNYLCNYTFLDLPQKDLVSLYSGALSNRYYNLGPRKITTEGVVNYMSTRNNAFSNRSQKGRLIVSGNADARAEPASQSSKRVLQDKKSVRQTAKDELAILMDLAREINEVEIDEDAPQEPETAEEESLMDLTREVNEIDEDAPQEPETAEEYF